MAQSSNTGISFEDCLAVYKVLLLTPQQMDEVKTEDLKSNFKRIVLTVHPDKNRHPLSNEAFLKASELFKSS